MEKENFAVFSLLSCQGITAMDELFRFSFAEMLFNVLFSAAQPGVNRFSLFSSWWFGALYLLATGKNGCVAAVQGIHYSIDHSIIVAAANQQMQNLVYGERHEDCRRQRQPTKRLEYRNLTEKHS
ncbi:MAG: hypothetical protein LBH14_04435 [Desulfobulbaceae bacterium]|jgi:hypothetical protein|nr:hypothetical protein [Desulfobulbaceae bacterium]